jgi:hypothetical protein
MNTCDNSFQVIWFKNENYIPVPKSPGDVSWKGLIQERSPGLNLEKFAQVSKNLRKFSLSEWQFIDPTTKQRNVYFQPTETAGFGSCTNLCRGFCFFTFAHVSRLT